MMKSYMVVIKNEGDNDEQFCNGKTEKEIPSLKENSCLIQARFVSESF